MSYTDDISLARIVGNKVEKKAPSDANSYDHKRKYLFNNTEKTTPNKFRSSWDAPVETEETKTLDNKSILDLQQKKIQEQDEMLNLLDGSVGRQKQLAIDIKTEVNDQIRFCEHLNDEVNSTTARVKNTTSGVEQINMKSSSTKLWLIICILFIILIVVIFLAFYF